MNDIQQSERFKVIESVFEDFFLVLMKDHYMTSFIKNHHSISTLVESQSKFLFTALFEKTSHEMQDSYYRISTIHWNVRLDESYIYKMLDFVSENLSERVRNGQIQLDLNKLYEVLHKIRNATGYTYTIGSINDTLENFKPQSKEANFKINFLKSFRNHLLKIYNWNEQPIDAIADKFSSNPSISELGIELSTTAFLIRSHTSRKTLLKLESLNQSLHESAKFAVRYFEINDFCSALTMVKHILHDVSLIITLLEQLSNNWHSHKTSILLEFLADKSLSGGLFSLSKPSLGASEYATNFLFKDISNHLKHDLNSLPQVYAFNIDESLYIYFDQHNQKKGYEIDLLETINDSVHAFIAQHHLPINESLLNVGFVDTKLLKQLNIDEMREIIRVFELKTGALTVLSGKVIHSLNFADSINSIIAEIKDNLYLKSLVAEKINNHDVVIHYHPIVHVGSGKTLGAEALVRIANDGQVIAAGRFIDIVNDYDLYTQLDLVVLNTISSELEQVSTKYQTLFLNINPMSLRKDEVIKNLKGLVNKAEKLGIDLVLELTEYSMTSELESLKSIRSSHFKIAVDDFGTGYTNFEIVMKLKEQGIINILKVDGGLVKTIVDSDASKALLETILILGDKLGLKLVLEFIEDEKIVNEIQALCDLNQLADIVYGQGWYYSKPQPISK